jgi:pectate lyase
MRLLAGLTSLTGDVQYREAAEAVFRHMFDTLSDANGLFYWGGHVALDLESGELVTAKSGPHELKCYYPFYELMWEVDTAGTRRYIEAFWNAHIYDWSVLDFSRHGKYDRPLGALWDHAYKGGPIFFVGRGLTFINCGSDLYYAAGLLHHFTGDPRPLAWARQLNQRFLETRNPATGMGGYQFTLRYLPGARFWTDRAIHQFSGQLAGHFVAEGAISHPRQIRVIAGHAGLCRMALAEALGEAGREFRRSAIEDLIAYGKWAYEPEENVFHATHTDGTRLTGMVFEEEGYYGAKGSQWSPVKAGGLMLRAYATAYRLSEDRAERAFLWQMTRDIARGLDLGHIGDMGGDRGALNESTGCADHDALHALLELHEATGHPSYRELARQIAANILAARFQDGFFVRDGVAYVDDPAPLALLRLAAVMRGEREQVRTGSR